MLSTRILGGTTAALTIALLFVMWRADVVSTERDTLQAWQNDTVVATRLASGQDDLPVDQVGDQILSFGLSVETLKGQIALTNQQALQRAAEFERQQRLALEELDRFKAAAARSNRRIDQLQAIAARPDTGECAVPPELLEALKGL